MHNNKVSKVLGAGLALALAFSSVAPALAEAYVDASSAIFGSESVDFGGGKPSETKFGVKVSYETKDGIDHQRAEFATKGEGYFQTLESISTDNSSALTNFDFGKAKNGSSLGNYMVDGTWEAKAVTLEDASNKVLKRTEISNVTIEVRHGIIPDELVNISATGLTLRKAQGDDAYVSIPVSSVTDSDGTADAVQFVYSDPSNEEIVVSATQSGDNWTGKVFATEGVIPQTGKYTLKEIRALVIRNFDKNGDLQSNKASNNKTYFTLKSWTFVDSSSEDLSAANFELSQPYQPMLRLYNPGSGEHFYTAKAGEKDLLVKEGWKFEGIGFYAANSSSSKTKVNRLYNGFDHHYASDGEAALLEKLGWKNEGVAFYSSEAADRIGLYRLYNPNASSGAHHYTTSTGELELLKKAGWKYEGVSFYGTKPSGPRFA
ncbi:MAG: hypothetical protein Q4B54_08910 [Coriobacteriales bacterium]|nr:hypothetical protein [Coriobacteriales bacterium]